MPFLIVDVRDGGVDGYYSIREDAEYVCETWKTRLGHSDVVVAEVQMDTQPGIGNKCFLGNRDVNKMLAEEKARKVERN